MEYNLNGHPIKIEMIIKRNKNIYMRFINPHTLLVTCNKHISLKEITTILAKNEKSLIKMQNEKKKESEQAKFFHYLGVAYEFNFDAQTQNPFFNGNQIVAKDEQTLAKFYQKECQRVFQSELKRIIPYFPNIPQFTLKIRNMKTRWGVNNRGNNTITLNSELLKKDLDLLDYVIIHELCHFYEANHSASFWQHVEEYYPKYKEVRKRLRG
jgi:hypothetical protein